jgi:2-polyprenyl-6-methoxyphenol hydroxylase-like FAD-dependent oxidoreductase
MIELNRSNASENKEVDLVIVGGGIGGLFLALLAARHALSVLVLDHRTGLTSNPFPTTIGPRGLALLDEIGLLEPLAEKDIYPCDQFHFLAIGGEPLLHADYHRAGLSPRKGLFNLILNANILESLLIETLSRHENVSICWGSEFVDLLSDKGMVCGVSYQQNGKPLTVRARLTVGADGRSSSVRRVASLPTRDRTPKAPMLVLLVQRPDRFHRDVRYYLGQGEMLGLFPRSSKEMVLLYMDTRKTLECLQNDGIERLTRRLSQIDSDLTAPLRSIDSWKSIKAVPCSTVRALKWGTPGLCLMGDAAHTLTPHMAQGVTQAMLDAETLADLLSRLSGDAEMAHRLPVQYEGIRRPEMDRLHNIAWEYEILWDSPNPVIVFLRNRIFQNVGKSPRLLRKVVSIEGGLTTRGYSLIERFAALTGLPLDWLPA